MLACVCCSLWSHCPYTICPVMCNDDSDMPVFTDTATWIWMKAKQPVLTWNTLIKERNSTAPPHSVWSGALIKHEKRGTFLHFKFAAFQKSLCLLVMPGVRLADKEAHRARWLKWQTGGKECAHTRKPIITGNMRVSELRDNQLKCDREFQCWNGLKMGHIVHVMFSDNYMTLI